MAKRDYDYIQGDLDGAYEFGQLLQEVGEEYNFLFNPNSSSAAHLVLTLLDALIEDKQWVADDQKAVVQAVQEACEAKVQSGKLERNLTKPGEINQLAFDMVKPHLEIAGPSVERGTPTFAAARKRIPGSPG
jgi:hypothetical protein